MIKFWLPEEKDQTIIGLKQAAGVVGYVILFAIFITNAERMFPHMNKTVGPVLLLTLFCFSVLACGLIVFYRPYMMFVEKRSREAINLVMWTTRWLGIFLLLVIFGVAMISR